MSPSHRANHYGTLVERKAAERYNLMLQRCSWHDALREDGTPVEVKAAKRTHADGQPGNFKIYDEYHEHLRSEGGYYVFALSSNRTGGRNAILGDATLVTAATIERTWRRRPSERETS